MRNDTIARAIGEWFIDRAARLIGSKVALRKLQRKAYPAIQAAYGDFRFGERWRHLTRTIDGNESGLIFGQAARMISDIEDAAPMLLAGESSMAKPAYAEIAGISTDCIMTAGLHGDADVAWNFEKSAPLIGPFRCIVSHAIIEHLLNPYGHIADLRGMLLPGGSLIVYTVMPGFGYHRHPVDCLRFFPDWFEEIGQRLDMTVRDRFIGDEHIVYAFSTRKEY